MENKEFLPVYPYSHAEAQRLGELDAWEQSHQENVACRKAIEAAIMLGHDGRELSADCAGGVIEKFGYHRTAFVLANSLVKQEGDRRISKDNLDWARQSFVPPDSRNWDCAVGSHPAVLDGFVSQYRRAYQSLGLFDHTHCLPDAQKQDFEGKVVVLSPQALSEQHFTPEKQLWLCTGGFGSHAGARGRAVYATCLADGKTARLDREDFAGVLTDYHLPGWAREKLARMQGHTPREEPGMGGMTMQ